MPYFCESEDIAKRLASRENFKMYAGRLQTKFKHTIMIQSSKNKTAQTQNDEDEKENDAHVALRAVHRSPFTADERSCNGSLLMRGFRLIEHLLRPTRQTAEREYHSRL
jgi:hypothetical protein